MKNLRLNQSETSKRCFKGRAALTKFLNENGITEFDIVQSRWGGYMLYMACDNQLVEVALPKAFKYMSEDLLKELLLKNDVIQEVKAVEQTTVTELIHFGGPNGKA
jgi:hypothetical protein